MAAGGAEINAAIIESIDGHGIAQDVDIAILLRETLGERLPLVASGAAAVNAQLAFVDVVLAVALDGDYLNCLGQVGVHDDD